VKHTEFEQQGDGVFKVGGEPMSIGDTVVINNEEYTLRCEPSVSNCEGFLIKAWGIELGPDKWFSIAEVFRPELRRDH
jgi:hypothetical protein